MSIIRIRIRIRLRGREQEQDRRGVVGRTIDRFRGRFRRGGRDEPGSPDRGAEGGHDGRDGRSRDDDAARRDPLRDVEHPDRHRRDDLRRGDDSHRRDDLRDGDDRHRRDDLRDADPDRRRVRDRDDQLQDVHDRRDDDDPGESHHRVTTDEYWERHTMGGACPLCLSLDGERWDTDPGGIKLHPHCRCRKVHVRDTDRRDRDDPTDPPGLRGGQGLR